MNNNLTGITLSALVHVGVLSWASGISNEPVKKPLPLDSIALTVSLFEAEKVTPPVSVSTPPLVEKIVIKKAEPLVAITKPLIPTAKPSPPIKISSLSPIPEIAPEVEPELKPKPLKSIVASVIEKKSTPKAKITAPIPVISKPIPKILISKKVKKPKRTIKKKIRIKKITPKRIVKKTIKRKVIKKTAVIKKRIILKKRIVTKAQPRPRAISTPIKRKSIITKRRTERSEIMLKHSDDYPKGEITNRVKTGRVAKRNRLNKPKKANIQTRKHTSSVPATSKQSLLSASLSKQYKARLQRLIASKKRYPKRARRRGYQGKITVSFKVIHSGIISEIRIAKSSKYKDLNTATLNAIKQASGKLPYTKGMNKKSLSLSVTLAYILR